MKKFLKKTIKKLIKLIITLYFMLFSPRNEKILNYLDGDILFCKIISLLAKNNTDFFFIQIGSCDGIKGDPIHSYVKKYHWSGILLEPVKYSFEKLVKNYNGQKNLIFENMAISDINGLRDFYYLKETTDSMPCWYDRLGSFLKDNILKHKYAIPNIEKYILAEKVKTIKLETLIQKHNVKKIDLLHIDAEGYDYNILKSINFKNIKPKMILFEHKHLCNSDYKESKNLLRKNNYSLIKKGADTFAYRLFFRTRLKVIFQILLGIVKNTRDRRETEVLT